jgi:hypothetical protein
MSIGEAQRRRKRLYVLICMIMILTSQPREVILKRFWQYRRSGEHWITLFGDEMKYWEI